MVQSEQSAQSTLTTGLTADGELVADARIQRRRPIPLPPLDSTAEITSTSTDGYPVSPASTPLRLADDDADTLTLRDSVHRRYAVPVSSERWWVGDGVVVPVDHRGWLSGEAGVVLRDRTASHETRSGVRGGWVRGRRVRVRARRAGIRQRCVEIRCRGVSRGRRCVDRALPGSTGIAVGIDGPRPGVDARGHLGSRRDGGLTGRCPAGRRRRRVRRGRCRCRVACRGSESPRG